MLKAVPQEVPRKGKSGQRGRDPVPQVRDGRQSASEVIQHFKSRKSQRFPSALLELPSEPTVHELIRLLGKDQKNSQKPNQIPTRANAQALDQLPETSLEPAS